MPDERRVWIQMSYEEAITLGRVFARALPSVADLRLELDRRRAQSEARDGEPGVVEEDGD